MRPTVVVSVLPIAVCGCYGIDDPEALRFGSDLHTHPAACGLPDYQWIDSDELGRVVAREPLRIFEKTDNEGYLQTLAEADAAIVHATPERRVFVDRIRYVTQNQGELVEATGLIAYPDPREVGGPLSLVIHTHGTTGYTDACAPSRLAEDPVAFDALLIGVFASIGDGAVVVAPDYLGMSGFGAPSQMPHPYLVGEPTALASLDAGRAARQVAREEGIPLDGTLVEGASQGGHAAAMTVLYQPHYAVDLPLRAAVTAIPPTDLYGHARRAVSGEGLAGPVNIGNIVAVLLQAQRWYGVSDENLYAVVDEDVARSVKEVIDSDSCALPEVELPFDQVFTPAAIAGARSGDIAQLPEPWGCIFARSSLIDTDVERLGDAPSFVVLGSEDDLVDPVVERAAAATLCERGQRIVLRECAGRDHGGAFLAAIDDMLAFFDVIRAGETPDDVCQLPPAGLCSSDPLRDDANP